MQRDQARELGHPVTLINVAELTLTESWVLISHQHDQGQRLNSKWLEGPCQSGLYKVLLSWLPIMPILTSISSHICNTVFYSKNILVYRACVYDNFKETYVKKSTTKTQED